MKVSIPKSSKRQNALIQIRDFSGGYSSLLDEARMPAKFAVQAYNLMQFQDGVWGTRWGINYFGDEIQIEEPQVFSNGYSHRRIITVDPSKIVSVTNLPLYVNVVATYLATTDNGGEVTNVDGYDIRFETLGGAKLSHEVISWDGTTGKFQAYVKLPTLSASSNQFYIYYGNSEVSSPEEDPTNVFPSTQKALYRFEDSALTTDSSGNSHDLTAVNVPVQGTPKFGAGCVGLGTSQAYSAVDHVDFRPAGNFSISAWIRTNKVAIGGIFESYSANTNVAGLRFFTVSTTGYLRFESGKNTGTTIHSDYERADGNVNVCDGVWHHVVATYNGSRLHIYIDGAEDGTGTSWTNAPVFAETNYVKIGCLNSTGTNINFFQGLLDEVAFFPSDALSLEEIQSLYAESITDASNAAILAKAKAVYLFEDGALTTDSSGNSHTLTAIGTPTAITTKFNGNVFLGNLSAYSAVDHADLKPTGAFTVGGWVKSAAVSSGADQYIFQSLSQNTNVAGFFMIVARDTGYLLGRIGKNTGTTNNIDYITITGTTNICDGNWHFVVMVWDTQYLRLYVDGISNSTPIVAFNPAYAATNYVRVGCRNLAGSNANFITGQLDDIFLINGVALTADEILMRYNNSLQNFLSTANEILEYYDIDGATEYVSQNGTNELIVVCGGYVLKSVNGEPWVIIGNGLTPNKKPSFIQIKSELYICNGYDDLVRYDGTDLKTYTSIDPVDDLQASLTGLTSGSYNYYYVVTALNSVGETEGSNEVTVNVNKERSTWEEDTEYVSLTWSAISEATRYRIYAYDQSGYEVYLGDSPTNSYTDIGTVSWNEYIELPDDNTTAAPKFTHMEISGNRIWAVGDPDNPYTVYWTGVGQYLGSFSPFYGGGSINLEKGGKEIPRAIVHYKTGKGDPITTVLCSSPEGLGAIWQISLDSVTVSDVTFILPTVYKVVGSIGTNSPSSVVKAGDNIGFANKKGVFFLRNKPQMLNVLSTDETSQPIRPNYRSFNQAKIDDICAYYYEGKIFFSATEGSENDIIFIYDLERNNWTYKWDKGVKAFLEYTESNTATNASHFLAVPTSGSRLWEISEKIEGDFGQPFLQSYISPLIPVSKDKTDIMKTKESLIELGRQKGNLTYEILGIEADKGFSVLGSRSIISSAMSNSGPSTDLASDFLASDTNNIPTTFTQATSKKAIKIRKKVYAVQHKIYTSSLGAKFTILSIQTKGRLLPKRTPRSWLK